MESITSPAESPKVAEMEKKTFRQELIRGLIVLVCAAVSWTAAVQFGKSALTSSSLNAPFFLTYFGTVWMVLCYPVFFIGLTVFRYFHRGAETATLGSVVRNHALIHLLTGKSTFSTLYLFSIVCILVIFTALWLLANYAYNFALTVISATEASVVSSTNMAIVYILSLVFLKDSLSVIKIIALLLTTGGNVLVAYSEGFGSFGFEGVMFALVSAFAAAVYKVFLKKTTKDASLGQISFFLSMLGIINLALFWPFTLVLFKTGNESADFATAPWGFMVGSAVLGLAFNFVVNFGVALTHPLYVSIGMFSGIPLNALIDFLVRKASFSRLQLIGSLMIVVSLILMLFPPFKTLTRSFRPKNQVENVDNG